MYQTTTALSKITALTKRIRVIQGGTSAGKTIGILLYLINKAQTEKLVISVVAEYSPQLRRGPLKDFLSIMQEHKYYIEDRYNRTDRIYTFETGSTMEFFAVDEVGKVRGPRRDILFINEANNITYEVFDQLEVRTNQEIIIDFNPVSEFWAHTEIIPKREHDFLKLTYLDNEALDPRIKESIESRRDKENWWRIYGLGEVGIFEGTIYKDWEFLDRIPPEARLEGYGLDFGYSIDPTALVAVYYYDNSFILDEIIYQTGLTNNEIAQKIKPLPKGVVVADSAEPKSIEEIKRFGIQITPSTKGADSVNNGIQLVQGQTIKITKVSTNLIKEYRNYLWKTNKDGVTINTPEDIWNHGLDAIRYFIMWKKKGSGFSGLLDYQKQETEDGSTRQPTESIIAKVLREGTRL